MFEFNICSKYKALGIVSRCTRSFSLIAAYFFIADCEVDLFSLVGKLRPDTAVAAFRTNTAALKNGRWTIIGKLPNWNREEWPMPKLYNELIAGSRKVAVYDDSNPSTFLRYEEAESPNLNFKDGASGYKYIEDVLSLISKNI